MRKKITLLILLVALFTSFSSVKATTNITVSNITTSVTDTGATITWVSSAAGDSQIKYAEDLAGLTNAKWQVTELYSSGKINHTATLTGLKSNTWYTFEVRTTNSSVGEAVPGSGSFTTQSNATGQLTVSNITTNATETGATITWVSSAAGDSQIKYAEDLAGLTNAKWQVTELYSSGKINHTATLASLKPNTWYTFEVRTTNSSVGEAVAGSGSFTTKKQVIFDPQLSDINKGLSPRSDLIINDLMVGEDNGQLYVKFKINNSGASTTEGQIISLKAVDLETGDIYTSGYSNSFTGTKEILSSKPLITKNPAEYKLRATIDYANVISESNENNNILERTLSFDKPQTNNNEPKKSTDAQLTNINNRAKSLNDGKLSELLVEIKLLRNQLREQSAELKYLKSFATEMRSLSSNMQTAIKAFIAYGVDDNTKKLGEGERAAVINSYKSAFDKLPETESELADAIKIANGRWPSATSDDAEKKAKKQFQKIYKRIADMNNANDNAAITVMAYGLRQKAQNRNMNSEKAGIKTFKHIFGSTPKTTEDWNTMQAITYSGAKK